MPNRSINTKISDKIILKRYMLAKLWFNQLIINDEVLNLSCEALCVLTTLLNIPQFTLRSRLIHL